MIFFWVGKRLTPEEKDQFWLMGNKAFIFEQKTSRIYPQKNLFSHILGQTDDTNNGISGMEKFLNKNLNNKNQIKTPISLTLDSNLQYLIRKELISFGSTVLKRFTLFICSFIFCIFTTIFILLF